MKQKPTNEKCELYLIQWIEYDQRYALKTKDSTEFWYEYARVWFDSVNETKKIDKQGN